MDDDDADYMQGSEGDVRIFELVDVLLILLRTMDSITRPVMMIKRRRRMLMSKICTTVRKVTLPCSPLNHT